MTPDGKKVVKLVRSVSRSRRNSADVTNQGVDTTKLTINQEWDSKPSRNQPGQLTQVVKPDDWEQSGLIAAKGKLINQPFKVQV